MNGDHWLLYITKPQGFIPNSPTSLVRSLKGTSLNGAKVHCTPKVQVKDSTIEILMTQLSPTVGREFNFPDEPGISSTLFDRARKVSSDLGITDIFPPPLTTLDSYAFSPCGYSANALVKWGEAGSSRVEDHDPGDGGEGYYTIHVTPEEGWSYASFECNVPISPAPAPHSRDIPDLGTLVRRVVGIFRPGRLTVTLFVSSDGNDEGEEEVGESAIEAAQRAFKIALTNNRIFAGNEGNGNDGVYTRTDKINYDFGDYDLAFASFELIAS